MATYQAYAAPIADTLAHFLNVAQFFGGGFTTLGWVAQTGHGELAATGTGASYAWTNPVLPTVAVNPPVQYTFKGAWVSGATYVGGNTAGLLTECDVVTSAGITYVHITASSSLTTAPASDTTNWQPLQFEIWKSNGANTASLPIYIKLVYTTAGSNGMRILLSIGTGVDSNGNLLNCLQLTSIAPIYVALMDNSTSSSGVIGEMDMAGDADNVRWIMYRGHSTPIYIQTLVIDRAKNSSGGDTDAYFWCGTMLCCAGGTQTHSSIMPNSAIGTGPVCHVSAAGWPGVIWTCNNSATFVLNGSTPPLPIYPLFGGLMNPLLGCVGFHAPDVTDGAMMPVWTYGAVHNYLVSKGSTAALSTLDNQGGNGAIPAILWE